MGAAAWNCFGTPDASCLSRKASRALSNDDVISFHDQGSCSNVDVKTVRNIFLAVCLPSTVCTVKSGDNFTQK